MGNLVISTNKNLRYSILLFLYFVQGFPVGVFFLTIPAWLAENNVSVAEIGYFSFMTTLPWTLKFVNGFIIDRFVYLPMGRRRAWLLGAFVFIIFTLITYAIISPKPEQLSLMAAFSMIVMLGTTFQDTAIDAMAADLVQEEELSIANGLMFGGQIIGVASGTALVGYLIANFGLATGMYTLAGIIGFAAIVMLFIRERPNEKLLPWLSGKASEQSELLHIHNIKDIISKALKAMSNVLSFQLIVILFLISLNYGIYISEYFSKNSYRHSKFRYGRYFLYWRFCKFDCRFRVYFCNWNTWRKIWQKKDNPGIVTNSMFYYRIGTYISN